MEQKKLRRNSASRVLHTCSSSWSWETALMFDCSHDHSSCLVPSLWWAHSLQSITPFNAWQEPTPGWNLSCNPCLVPIERRKHGRRGFTPVYYPPPPWITATWWRKTCTCLQVAVQEPSWQDQQTLLHILKYCQRSPPDAASWGGVPVMLLNSK